MIRRLYLLSAVMTAAAITGHGIAATPKAVPIRLEETLGQRRYGYPVRIDVPFPQGEVHGPEQLAVYQDEKPLTGVQYDALSRWADGSLQWAMVSLNRSPGPLEKEELELRYGPGVSHPSPGLPAVEETADEYVIRKTYRIPKNERSFVSSIRYGGKELLREPGTWSASAGEEVLERRKSRIVAGGPVNVVIERTGVFKTKAGEESPYRLTLCQPNSKSWLQVQIELPDGTRNPGNIGLVVPYQMDTTPLRYDFGVGGWVYGTLTGPGQTVLTVNDDRWRLDHVIGSGLTPEKRTGIAASSPAQPRAEGWGHLMDGATRGTAVAFGSPDFGSPGKGEVHHLMLDSKGTISLSNLCVPGHPVRAELFLHHVADPVHVTAVTSPSAMLHPLRVSLPPTWYVRCKAGTKPL